jgi:Flp pilus assembly pilin Flp
VSLIPTLRTRDASPQGRHFVDWVRSRRRPRSRICNPSSAGSSPGRCCIGRTSRQEGQALIEYALIVSLIAVVAIATLQLTGTNVKGVLNKIAGEV